MKISRFLATPFLNGFRLASAETTELKTATMETSTRHETIVVDSGSGYIKAGFAGDVFPRAEFASVVGRLSTMSLVRQALKENQATISNSDVVYLGEQIGDHNRKQLAVTYPISNGIVQNWDDMQQIWQHTFTDVLKTTTKGKRIMLTDPPQNPKSNREKMLEVMFETFQFAGAFVQIQAILTLYSQGLLTGLVVDSGDGVTHAVPVVDGFSAPHLTRRLNVAGRHITTHLVDLLQRRGYALNPASDLQTVAAIKEKMCYVAHNYAAEVRLAQETVSLTKEYTLPDGRTIRIGAERFTAPEALFSPSLVDVEGPGVAQMVHDCIQHCDIDNRMALYNHIVVSGGTTMFAGFASRLAQELEQKYLQHVLKGDVSGLHKLKLKVEDPPRRKHMVFEGAAVLAGIMKDRDAFWVSKEEWAEDPHRALSKLTGAAGPPAAPHNILS